MEIQILLSFLGASVLLTLMPGPDNIFVLTESLTKGRRNGIAISLGLSMGIMIHTTAAATGISIIIQQSALAFSIIKYFGAAYLFYLAIMAVKEKKPSINLISEIELKEKLSFIKLMRKGLFMNVLNPKVSLFFIAFLPQFIGKSGLHATFQMLILGFVFMLQSTILFILLAQLSGSLSKYLNSPRFWKYTKWSKVSVLAILGLTLSMVKK